MIRFALILLCACGAEPTLTNVQREVFAPSCAFSACHKGGGAEGLNLEGATHAKIVDVSARGAGASDRVLVVPGNPNASYVFEKVTKDRPQAGDRMPGSGVELSGAQIDLLRRWIAAGAKDD